LWAGATLAWIETVKIAMMYTLKGKMPPTMTGSILLGYLLISPIIIVVPLRTTI